MFKIVAGSSCDLSEEMKKDLDISLVPFKLDIDGQEFIDDENLDVIDMIDKMNNGRELKTACPAPGDFLKAYEGEEDVFVITISKNLSGAYNSALIAKDMMLEKNPDKKIHIFDAKSASAGETLTALKLKEEIDKNLSFEEIVENMNKYINEVKTFFILESLNNLIKNGRISKASGLIASVLNFKPIMQDDGDGNITLYEKVRGTKKAFAKLVEAIKDRGKDTENLRLVITHVNALDRAMELREEILKNYNLKEIVVVQTAGLCSSYADDGGIVLAY